MTAEQPGERHPAAAPQAESLDRFVCIDRAGRQMAAVVADERRERMTINPDQGASEIARQPDSQAYDRMWGRIRHDECVAGVLLLHMIRGSAERSSEKIML